MAGNVLTGRIQITAPGVKQTFDGLGNSLSKLQKQVSFFGGGVTKFNAALGKVPPAMQNFTRTTSSATLALTNLGRIVQDAPFGFLGIANNLNPLLESFQRLRVQTGSVGGAFKALAKDLGGAGGLGLALSVVSSAVLFFGGSLNKSKKEAEEHKKEIELVEFAYDRFVKALQDVTKSLAAEGLKFQILSDSLADSNLGIETRKQVIDELVKSYSSYLPNLDKEKQTYDAINDSLAQSIQLLARNAEIKAVLPEIEGILQSMIKAQVDLNRLRRFGFEKEGELNLGFNVLDEEQYKQEEARLTGFIKKQTNEIKTAKAFLNNLAGSGANLIEILFGKQVTAPAPKIDKPDKEFIVPFPKLRLQPREAPTINLDEIKTVLLGGDLKTFKERVEENINKGIEKLVVAPRFNFSAEVLANRANLARIADAAKSLAESFSSALTEGFSGAFEGLGEGIGNILAGQDFGSQILEVFSSLLKNLGKALIKFGIIKEGIDKILGPGGIAIPGGVAIGLGIFAIAASQLLKNISARALGGPVQAGGTYLVGERGPELFRPNTGGEIIPNNQLGGRGLTGGGINVNITGTFVQRGMDMIAVLALANQSKSRLQ